MRLLPLAASVALTALACASSPSQTGPILDCGGISLSEAGAFTPLSGMAFQTTANIGGGQSAPGTFEVVLWGASADGGSPSASMQTVCQQLKAGAFTAAVFVAPQTVEFNLPDTLTTKTYATTVYDLTQPLVESAAPLEDIKSGSVSIGGVDSRCLSGSFSAQVVPVDPISGFAIDGGVAIPISGSFGVPFCAT